MTSSSPSSSNKRPLSLANVVSSVQSSWRSSNKKTQPDEDVAGAGQNAQRQFPLELDPSQSVTSEDDNFPYIDDKRLISLFPIINHDSKSSKEAEVDAQQKRLLVRQALEEMELNWKLDTKPLGERSETNRGTALIVGLLKQIQIKSDSSDPSNSKEIKPGVESEFLPDPDNVEGSEDRNGGKDATKSASSNLVKAQPRAFETHDVLRAIDRKDHETLLAIRNSNFDLLLDLAPGGVGGTTSARNTPLGYSISLGKGNESTSIVLIGALSKFVNTLPDIEDDEVNDQVSEGDGAGIKKKMVRPELDPQTQNRLRKLKVNLKLAIDASILSDQTGLLSSYMQVLVMSEGSAFIHSSIQSVSRSIQSRLTSRASHGDVIASEDPIQVARDLVLRFVTENLRAKSGSTTTTTSSSTSTGSTSSRVEATASRVASVDDYISNSTGDLLMMAFWTLIKLKASELKSIQEDPASNSVNSKINVMELSRDLPSYFFARDDRVTSHFIERVEGIGHLIDLEPTDGKTNLIRKSRANAFWRKSEMIAQRLSSGTRRLNSTERLEILQRLIMS